MRESALHYHAAVRAQLSALPVGCEDYRQRLFKIANIPAQSLVSTAEHVAPFNVADAVSFVLPQILVNSVVPENERRPVVILGGALVPLDNRHYPRGFIEPHQVRSQARYNLFSQTQRKTAALLQPPLQVATGSNLQLLLREHSFLTPCFSKSECESYADQIARAMEAMVLKWDLRVGENSPLLVRPLEAVARRFLLTLLDSEDPIISAILFDESVRHELKAKLHGVFCAWGEAHGSFLFWGARRRRTVRLIELSGRLVGDDIDVPIRATELAAALRNGDLWPGVFLSLLAVSYLPGVPVSGGPKQNHYYRKMIEALNSSLALRRPTALSVLGYMAVAPEVMPGRFTAERLAKTGTGLDLVRRGLDLSRTLEIMQTTPPVFPRTASIPQYR